MLVKLLFNCFGLSLYVISRCCVAYSDKCFKKFLCWENGVLHLSLAYEFFFKPEPGLWPFIGLFFWPGLAYLKAWPGLQAYLQAYFILIY